MWRGLQVGGVLKTPFRAHASREYSQSLIGQGIIEQVVPPTEEDVTFDFPWAFGFGLAYRFSDRWTASMDVTRVEWGAFTMTQTDPETGIRVKTSPFTGTPADEADVGGTTTVRAGAEFLFVADTFVVPVRGGLFYDPLPARGGPDNYLGFSLGSGLVFRPVAIDLAYTFRYGWDVMGDLLVGVSGLQADVSDHRLLFSCIVYF